MLVNLTKRYMVAGVLVEATKSVGGGFYDVTVIAAGTFPGQQSRIRAKAFEMVAKPVKEKAVVTDRIVDASSWENEGGQ
jgi:hypothetical protein